MAQPCWAGVPMRVEEAVRAGLETVGGGLVNPLPESLQGAADGSLDEHSTESQFGPIFLPTIQGTGPCA